VSDDPVINLPAGGALISPSNAGQFDGQFRKLHHLGGTSSREINALPAADWHSTKDHRRLLSLGRGRAFCRSL
jgi:hypothetical protein